MKNVLWITGIFPPINCGVGRQYKLAKYLPQFGWNPIVLAMERSIFRPQVDESTLRDIKGLEVHRTKSGDSKLRQIVLPHLLRLDPRTVNLPDPWYGWEKHALVEGRKIIEAGKRNGTPVDALFSSSLPNTCHLVAKQLKAEYRLPWVADFRDLWTMNTGMIGLKDSYAKGNAVLEESVMESADYVTIVNSAALAMLREKYPFLVKKSTIVSHGYDPSDFPLNRSDKYRSPKLLISFLGTLTKFTRPDEFLRTFRWFLDDVPEARDRVLVEFTGHSSPAIGIIDELSLHDHVTLRPPINRRSSHTMMVCADLLLVLVSESPSGHHTTPGKVYDYLGAGRPILAVCPEGELRRLIRYTRTGIVCHPQDRQNTVQVLKRVFRQWSRGRLQQDFLARRDAERAKSYSVIRKARDMATILQEVCVGT